MLRRLILICTLLPFIGCTSGYKTAPVSGRITVDGRPLAKAHVHFAPIAAGGNVFPGPTSQGETDADGRFTLTLDVDRRPRGAVVGMHKVYIITVDSQATSSDMPDAGAKPKRRELLPERYNQNTTLTFEVPARGTDSANFDLTLKER